ncbi:MAG: hypothetical protein N2C14_21720, partial [Planctomycetales bacterium]
MILSRQVETNQATDNAADRVHGNGSGKAELLLSLAATSLGSAFVAGRSTAVGLSLGYAITTTRSAADPVGFASALGLSIGYAELSSMSDA